MLLLIAGSRVWPWDWLFAGRTAVFGILLNRLRSTLLGLRRGGRLGGGRLFEKAVGELQVVAGVGVQRARVRGRFLVPETVLVLLGGVLEQVTLGKTRMPAGLAEGTVAAVIGRTGALQFAGAVPTAAVEGVRLAVVLQFVQGRRLVVGQALGVGALPGRLLIFCQARA